jgi:trans-aconitate methyltransferase
MNTNKWNARDYADNSSAQTTWANELIEKLSLQGNEHLLDLGCGDGRITNSIAEKITNGQAVGIDRSEEMINLAKGEFNRENLSFHCMDVTSLSLQKIFDVVFSNAALHWVKDHCTVLRQLKKILHSRSKLLLQMGGHGNAADILAVLEQLMQSKQWAEYFTSFEFPYRFCTVRDYEQWLPEAGYRAERIELIPKDMIHDSWEQLKGWLRTTWFPYTDRLPAKEKENFLNSVIDRYCELYPVDKEGRTLVKMVRLEVEAVVV